jgi:glycosyltransferase involved in cell wall biosynthesis
VFWAARPDVLFVFACRPKTDAAATVERGVRAAVSAMPFASSIAFLRDVSSFPALLALATVVIFPVTSLHNKMDIPLTLLEAMALGRPIVVSNLESLSELLPEPAGVLVPPGDADALGAAVARILKDDPGRRAMGDTGRDLVRRQFSAERMTAEYEELYAELLS